MGDTATNKGRVLADRYRLEERLGEGGFGSIWRAEHLVLAAPVAVKLIDPEIAEDENAVERFIREARAAASLRSPHVVQIIDYGVDEGELPFMVMELLEGENLAERLKRSGRIAPVDATRIISHVARAVGRAHDAGIVHRDLKPENVFLVPNEDAEIAKVLDFGVAKVETAALGPKSSKTRTGSLLGTPYYMSPEQAQGNKEVDFRSDLWSLGVIGFEILTGKRPFFSDGLGDLVLQICVRELPVPSEFAPVPPGLDEWFARACARDPEHRFQSARELSDAFREALGIDARETMITVSDGESAAAARALSQAEHAKDQAAQARTEEAPPSSKPQPKTKPKTPKPTKKQRRGEPALAEPAKVDAATIRADAPTVQLFGTSSQTPPPAKKQGSWMVVAVAAGALVAGLVGGLALLDAGGAESAERPLPDAGEIQSDEPDAGAQLGALSDLRKDEGVTDAAADAEPTSEDASLDAADAGDAGSVDLATSMAAALKKKAEEEREKAQAASSAGKPDAWVKPDWARPDEEPKTSPVDELLKPPPPNKGDNPY